MFHNISELISILCFGSFQLFSIFCCYKQHSDAHAFSYIFGQSIIISLKLIARSRIAECDRNWGLAHQYLFQPPPWMPSYIVQKPKCYNLTSAELSSAGILDIIQILLWDTLLWNLNSELRMENRLKASTSETISDVAKVTSTKSNSFSLWQVKSVAVLGDHLYSVSLRVCLKAQPWISSCLNDSINCITPCNKSSFAKDKKRILHSVHGITGYAYFGDFFDTHCQIALQESILLYQFSLWLPEHEVVSIYSSYFLEPMSTLSIIILNKKIKFMSLKSHV